MIVKICAIGFNADLKYAVFEEGGKTLAFCRHGSDAELIRAAATTRDLDIEAHQESIMNNADSRDRNAAAGITGDQMGDL